LQTDFGFGDDPSQWDGVFEIVRCRKALNPSGISGFDYALNPYTGCEHGCVYCYAPEVTHKPWDGWRVVRVKIDVAERLAKELPGLSGRVGIGTVTDPYQGAERRFNLTRRCLEVLSRKGFPVGIVTKSPLVLRDVDIIGDMDAYVHVSLSGVRRRESLVTEPGAPLPEERLDAIRGLLDAGIPVAAHVEPVLSHLEGREEELADALASTGVRDVYVGGLSARPELTARLERMGMRGSERAERRLVSLLRERNFNVTSDMLKFF